MVYDTRRDAVSIMTVDGARMERIYISNISCRNIKTSAIFIRLGNRNRTYREGAKVNTPHLKDVVFENIQGTRISAEYGCIVAGIKQFPIENVVLRNINLEFEGGGTKDQTLHIVPEEEQAYPNGLIFGKLPTYGFYMRHVKNITLDNIQLRTIRPDDRPAIICDDVHNLNLSGLQAETSSNAQSVVLLKNTRGALIHNNRINNAVQTMIRIIGSETKDITVTGNDFRKAKHSVSLSEEILKDTVVQK